MSSSQFVGTLNDRTSFAAHKPEACAKEAAVFRARFRLVGSVIWRLHPWLLTRILLRGLQF
ncbi:MAG TPA: hypothetical protein VKU02_31290, partial [Gemmataceae bacterium]|nr:hypothetical protein [Gemmataceae bacterium]